MTGIEFLEQARAHAPDAKLVLLTAYADTDVAIKAINDIGLDHYLLKPWDPPEERLYPVLDDLLERLAATRIPTTAAACASSGTAGRSGATRSRRSWRATTSRTAGSTSSATTRRSGCTTCAAVTAADLPLVLVPDGEPLRSPSTLDLAGALGLRTSAEQPLYDLCIVGGGPGRAGGRGVRRLRGPADRRRRARGARAGRPGRARRSRTTSASRGACRAPTSPQRAVAQARRFGAEMVLAREVVGFETRGPVRAVRFGDGTEIEARAVLVATGVSYRLLEAPGLGELAGRGVYYGATASEAASCDGDDVYVVGAANSAGQAALNLARYARRVVMLVRSDALEASDVAATSSSGSARPQHRGAARRPRSSAGGATVISRRSRSPTAPPGPRTRSPTNWLFVFIGASPRTDWLGDDVARDDKGFVITGPRPRWPRRTAALAARARAVRAGDERAGCVRRRRRSARLDEAGRVRGRRGRDVGLPRPPLPGDDLMDGRRAARPLPVRRATDEQLAELAAVGEEVALRRGRGAVPRGRPRRLLVGAARGRVDLVRRAGREEAVVMTTMDGPGVVGRRLPGVGRRGSYLATGRGASAGPDVPGPVAGARRAASREWFPFSVHLIEGFFQTVRSMDTLSRQREALIALGTLAAGLAHEINNPASAATRAVDALQAPARRCSRRSSVWPSGRCPPSSSSRSTGCGARSTLGRRHRSVGRRRPRGGALRLARRPRCRRGVAHRAGAGRRRRRRRVVRARRAVLDGDTLEPGLEWVGEHPRRHAACSPR